MAPDDPLARAAVAGWHALYRGAYEEDSESARVVAWALVDGEDGGHEVVGLVVAPDNPTKILPACVRDPAPVRPLRLPPRLSRATRASSPA